jgi:hypothetical protein
MFKLLQSSSTPYMQWKGLEDHIESTWNSLRTGFGELEARLKDVEELEAKELSFMSEMESKAKELRLART